MSEGLALPMPRGKLLDGGRPANKRSPTATDHAVGVQIRLFRHAAGMTLRELGEAVGVSIVQFQRYETGVSRVSASRLVAISEALGVRVDTLIVKPTSYAGDPPSRRRGSESVELLKVFNIISDPKHRQAIIALARAIAAGEEPASSATSSESE